MRERRRIFLDVADGDADTGHTDEHAGIAIDGQTDGAPHAGVAGQPFETRLRAARQVFMVDKEVLEQLEARGGIGQRCGRTADARTGTELNECLVNGSLAPLTGRRQSAGTASRARRARRARHRRPAELRAQRDILGGDLFVWTRRFDRRPGGGRRANGFGVAQIGVDGRDDNARLDGDQVDPDEGDAHPRR